RRCFRTCCEKSGEAVAAPASGRVFMRPLPVQRTACLSSITDQPRYLSLPEPPERVGGTASPHPGDCAEPGTLRISEDPGITATRRLASGQAPGVSALQGRRAGVEEEAPEAA